MKTLDASATHALLPYPAVADALAEVLRDRKAGKTAAPPRVELPLPGGVLFLMPATDGQIAITKFVTVHNDNAAAGLPVVQADVLVVDAATGRRLMLLDGAAVTARRTAALSLLAARLLAPNPSGDLLIVGAGVQARGHLEAFVAGLCTRRVYVTSLRLDHSEALAQHARSLGVEATAIVSPEDALTNVELIVTATTSTTPLIPDAVRESTFIAAIGAYRPDMVELAPDLVRRAALYVDTLEGSQAEAGDLIQAGVEWLRVIELVDALDGPRPAGGPVIFKSVGHALWDLAAARLAAASL